MRADPWRLYRPMVTSRLVEEAIAELWRAGRVSGEMHLGIGEEGVVAGVLDHLGDGDAVAADHRATPPMVMRGASILGVVAECLGSERGLGRGLGGHMHLLAKDRLAASSGIVGSSGPMACGFALAHRHLRPDRVAVAFFGEGAMNQGMLLESLNLAAVWRLPVVFACKDNGMAFATRSEKVTAGDLPDRARSLGVPALEVDGSDAEAVWEAARDVVLRARRGGGPGYLHASCVRPDGHFLGDPLLRMVQHPGAELGRRGGPILAALSRTPGAGPARRAASLGEVAAMAGMAARMRGRDPLARLRRRLASTDAGALERLEREVAAQVREAVDEAVEAREREDDDEIRRTGGAATR